jgi:TonB family protein
MSRLYQKCIVASGGLHLLLALVLVACPAFLVPKPRQSDVQPITFVPSILVDSPFSGGGNPNAGRPPASRAAPPAPPVQPTPAPAPQPIRQPTREAAPPKPETESFEVAKDAKTTKKKPQITLTPFIRNPKAKSTSKDTSTEDNQVRERLAMRNRVVGALDRTLGNIKSGTGSATSVDDDFGPGGGGPSYGSYNAWVWSYFDRAWVRPEDASSEDATVEASVTIASDGTVIAKRITKRSGDAAVDASVERVLDRVSTVERPFPEGAKDKQRTYTIPFNMKTKRGMA